MNFITLKKQFESPRFKKILYLLSIIIAALLLFQAGVFVGYKKARFAYRFGDNYYRTFGEPRHTIKDRFNQKTFSDTHGVAGTIIDVALPTLVVSGPDNIEKIVLIKDDTSIRRFRDNITAENLTSGDFVVIFGSPNEQSQIEARLIRIMPSPNKK